MSRSPITELKSANEAIERHLSSTNPRGEVAQDILAHLRNLIEHLAMAFVHGDTFAGTDYYKAINPAFEKLKKRHDMRFICDLHSLLQKSASHYTLSLDGSQRLLLKYREYLTLLRDTSHNNLGVEILAGLDNIDWDEDPGLAEYYGLILDKVDSFGINISSQITKDRYYVYSRKPVYSRGIVFYEYSLTPAMDFTSKFDHVVAFSHERIPTNYSISASIKRSSIPALGSVLPIMIIDGWRTSIRPCEINKILKILGSKEVINGRLNSYRHLMSILTNTGMSLVDLCMLPSREFAAYVAELKNSGKNSGIPELLEKSRDILHEKKAGTNVLSYLLHRPRNKIIEDQFRPEQNEKLSCLRLSYGCIPFDAQPYCTSLIGHSPSFNDLISCIDASTYEDNLLVRAVKEAEEDTGGIFISESELASFKDLDNLAEKYNRGLYYKHQDRKLIHDMGHCFIKSAEDDLVQIIQKLTKLIDGGVAGYRASTKAKLDSMNPSLDDPRKIQIASEMFDKSDVAVLYGSAGTGKTTLINIVCDILSKSPKIALANTNPAVDNLRRRINGSNCEFMTIAKYLRSSQTRRVDVLVVDECSTVSNKDMRDILDRDGFKLLLLVGDTHQIEAIRLGSWFEVIRSFLDKRCLFELEQPWRTASDDLISLWSSVRLIENDISERLISAGISKGMDKDIFSAVSSDEIILCLNYDGLYGINNINRMLQSSNKNDAIPWGLHIYKVGDPILFNESNRFAPVLYNNLKGKISQLELCEDGSLEVEVDVDTPLSEMDVIGIEGLEFIDSFSDGTTRLKFSISEYDEDSEGDSPKSSIVPFQVAYAVSIHKAQGLEYDSVKIVVTKDVENRITHNIFYTAITRARKHLVIYWSPETQNTVISGFSHDECRKDAQLISNRNNLKLQKR